MAPSSRSRRAGLSLAAATLASVAVAGMAGAANADTGPSNLVANGDFSSGSLSHWTCDRGTGGIAKTLTYGGAHVLSGTTTRSDDAQCTQTISVAPHSHYTLSSEVRGRSVYLGATGAGVNASASTKSARSWQHLTTSFTTGATTTSVTIFVHGWYGQGTYEAADVSLTGRAGAATKSSAAIQQSQRAADLPAHILEGYWQDFTNGAQSMTLASVPTSYNVVAVAFGTATTTPGQVGFSIDSGLSSALGGYTQQDFINDINTLHSRGQKVILSVGGANGTISVSDSSSASTFASSVDSLIKQYGFDGVDIDLENGVNATYMAQALQQLSSDVGSSLIITMAPQTVDVQSTGDDYFALALNIKNILTVMNTQYYNSGSMNGCNGNVYSEGSEDFLTALACIQLQGGLSPSQVGLGLPASTSAAGSGYVSPSVVNNALDCLDKGTNCGSFTPSSTYAGLRGAMTWSINWDASNGYNFANTVSPHLSTLN